MNNQKSRSNSNCCEFLILSLFFIEAIDCLFWFILWLWGADGLGATIDNGIVICDCCCCWDGTVIGLFNVTGCVGVDYGYTIFYIL